MKKLTYRRFFVDKVNPEISANELLTSFVNERYIKKEDIVQIVPTEGGIGQGIVLTLYYYE